jgi:BirA family biotin operon repressor/biotin-[acetyl-CoA-carboxylase] ligase
VTALVIGIGINLLSTPKLNEAHRVTTEPGSIFGETGIKLDPLNFSELIAHHYVLRENQFRTMGFSKIREIWMDRAAKLGAKIKARTPNFEYQGKFDSIDEKGQLIIINNGEKKKIAAAEIFFK